MSTDVTLCLTIGRRPELLRRTLSSILRYHEFEKIIAINDFRDKETNDVFHDVCPDGFLISLEDHIGHHRAVDYMYGVVETPYIFHCEDDWIFNGPIDFIGAKSLLKNNNSVSALCFRDVGDVAQEFAELRPQDDPLFRYIRLDPFHDQWYGYTFNPHLATLDLWRDLGGFSRFKKERHISRTVRAQNKFVAYDASGPCSHIGYDQSVSTNEKWLYRVLKKIL